MLATRAYAVATALLTREIVDGASARISGHAGLRGADAGRADRPRSRHRLRLFPAAASQGPGHEPGAGTGAPLRVGRETPRPHPIVAERPGAAELVRRA